MRGKDHEHMGGDVEAFHAKVQEVHGPVAETFLRTHLVMMHGASAPITELTWDGLVNAHRQLHPEAPVSTPQMPFPHTHAAEADGDLVTFHASHGVKSIRTHLERAHGVNDAATMPIGQVLQRHAEIHAVALNPAQRDEIAERDKRTYAAALLRRLAERTEEIPHADLPMSPDPEDSEEIASLDAVTAWLYGCATRVENGADL